MDLFLSVVLPISAIAGLGYFCAFANILSRLTEEGLTDFVFKIAIPVLIFRTLATVDFATTDPYGLWGVYFFAALLIWCGGTLVIRLCFGRDARAGVVAGMSAAYANTMLVGLPVVFLAYGDAGIAALSLLISVHMPVMTLSATLLQMRALRLDKVDGEHVSWQQITLKVVMDLMHNPIFIGVLIGGLWSFWAIPLGGFLETITGQLGAVAGTLALFTMGMSLHRYGIRAHVRAAFMLSVLKLVIMPMLVLLVASFWFAVPDIWLKALVIIAACPTGINAFLLAGHFKTGEALAATTITLSTILSAVSLTCWLYILAWF